MTLFRLAKPVDEWTQADVADFFVKNKTQYQLKDEHIKVVTDQEISGSTIFTLTEKDLTDLGLKLGPRRGIIKLISKLRDSVGPSEPGK